MANFLYTFRGDGMVTMGSCGTAGTCIINYAPLEINIIIIAKSLIIHHNVNLTFLNTSLIRQGFS